MNSPVITRFAPSPTGYLHIGGARTALFNWLYAKRHAGKMLLRIEDTDRERSTEPAIQAILDGLSWLGLNWDGEPIYQFSRAERHRQVAEELVASGKAYRAYDTAEELNDIRAIARAEGRFARYEGRWRDRDDSEAPPGIKPTIRLRSPLEGETIIDDRVQGRVAFPNKDLDDFVLLRSDGTPTYMLSVVVDDRDMMITHIIRGDDHFTNAARQKLLYEAMGWPIPMMAHIPLIHGADGAKLSKRHGALGVDAYRAMGYLPVALRNYLARLGWSHGDAEIMSIEEMINWFDIVDVGRSPSRFDFAKLENLNAHYIRGMADEELFGTLMATLPHLAGAQTQPQMTAEGMARLRAALPGLKERAKTLVELRDSAGFLLAPRPIPISSEADAQLTLEAKALLRGMAEHLASVEPWSAVAAEAAIRVYAKSNALKLGKLAQPLRAALTGKTTSPGVFDVLAALGREESLGRIHDRMG